MKRFFSILALLLFAVILAPVAGMAALPISIGTSLIFAPTHGVALAGLNREIWLAELMEGFYADDLFLSECRDLSPFVDNDIINLAEAGVNPEVIINNTLISVNNSRHSIEW